MTSDQGSPPLPSAGPQELSSPSPFMVSVILAPPLPPPNPSRLRVLLAELVKATLGETKVRDKRPEGKLLLPPLASGSPIQLLPHPQTLGI